MKKLWIVIAAALLLPSLVFAKGEIVGYAAGWADAPSSEQLAMLTHVMVFQVHPKPDGSLNRESLAKWLTKDWVKNAQEQGVKVCVAIGGWVEKGENKSPESAYWVSATNEQNRATFVENLVALVNEFELDGLDIDWEYPQQESGWSQYIKLCNELREKLPGKRLSSALPGSTPSDDRYTSVVREGIMSALDAVHLMAYDMESSWGNHAELNASKKLIDDWADWTEGTEGFDKEKLFLGVPFYAKKNWVNWKNFGNETLFNQDQYTPTKDPGKGVLQSYNGAPTLREKTAHCVIEGYGGIMIWELSQDFAPNNPLSLLNVIYAETQKQMGHINILVNHNEGGKVFINDTQINSGSSFEVSQSGSNLTLRVEANDGYVISEIQVARESVELIEGAYTIENVTESKPVKVSFGKRHSIPGDINVAEYSLLSSLGDEHIEAGGNLGFLEDGSYFEYMLNVTQAGEYIIGMDAAEGNGRDIEITIGDFNTIEVPKGSDWTKYTRRKAKITLPAGNISLRISVNGAVNIKNISISSDGESVAINNGTVKLKGILGASIWGGKINLSFPSTAKNATLKLFDVRGRMLMQQHITLNLGLASVALPKNIVRNQAVILQIKTNSGVNLTKKVLIK